MGGLHKGHVSLIKKAKKFKNKTLVSIYVNPKQFNKKEDYNKYPRNLQNDIKILKKLKINYLYLPIIKEYLILNLKIKYTYILFHNNYVVNIEKDILKVF